MDEDLTGDIRVYASDLIERVLTTGAGAAAAVLFADGTDLLTASPWETATVAAYAAVVSLGKGLVARFIGDTSPGLKR